MLNVQTAARVTYVADADTPLPPPVPGGTVALVEPAALPLPAAGELGGVPGWSRQVGGAWEWVMTGGADKIAQAVDAIPGPAGWSDQTARQVWLDAARALLRAGVPRPLLRQSLQAMYSAAVTNAAVAH